ncbi:D-lactate dehydrogenase [Abditibacterium utsteinense]|uniref:D-lactate dehydrogenase n=1 Tax=Abditibacterium utsteinense TaxID=1960156 RepID=A0A2S8STL1_9BACT|nr:2-hydroxyacid dehydrogenase [Abditibacterium utsteinense]PQV64142.1 D-lactate dehydrogenase [Abditibacterium utsteinense]
MNIAVFSTKPYDRLFLENANQKHGQNQHQFSFFEAQLNAETAILARNHDAVCAFVNDRLDAETLRVLAKNGVTFIAMRCAGFNNVDLSVAKELGIGVGRVPAYSPFAVAEHATALILNLNRKIHRAYNRVREGNFALEGLLGFDLHGKTVGVVGTGKIGICFVKIMLGFGCRVLCYDPFPSPELDELNVELVELPALLAQSDIVSLHCPLFPDTHHLMNAQTLGEMKRGAFLINTSRGGLVDTRAAIEALRSGQLGALGLDVYEEESTLFFEDRSAEMMRDDVFARLLAFGNVIVTGHQAFFTREALENIAATTVENLNLWQDGRGGRNLVSE